ncbi:MAG: hypothetical protein IT538_08500 [Variibacter sp.]|nr:hypothetical protein [Variibacter sp.]
MGDASFYRAKAEESLREAEASIDPKDKQLWLEISARWLQLLVDLQQADDTSGES